MHSLNTRVSDDAVQLGKLRGYLRGHRAQAVTMGNVQREPTHPSIGGANFSQRPLAASGDNNAIAAFVKGFRESATNAGAAARNKDCLTSHFHWYPLFEL
jgi:hypothetical protein